MAKQTIPTSKHQRANAAYLKGEFESAIALQREVIKDHIVKGKKAIAARKLLALYLYSAKKYDPAITVLKKLLEEIPDDSEIPENIGVMMRQSGRHIEAVKYLLKAFEMNPAKFNVCDGLAHCFHTLNKPEETQRFGRLSLDMKAAQTAENEKWPIPDGAPPRFDHLHPDRNVISFSLFGDGARYMYGALRNARLAADLYPGWTCRFYCDTRVPGHVVRELENLKCQVIRKPDPKHFYEGLMWRFEVIDDPTIDRFLIRDCDSVINIKERVAVDEWVASDKWFHMMRDYPSHTELILAGMWGGISGVLPPLADLEKTFNPQTAATRTYDQHFLREKVWPTISQSVLIHDSIYTGSLGSVPFPTVGQLPPNRHVGQNEAAVIDQSEIVESLSKLEYNPDRFFIFGQSKSGTTFLQQLLHSHPRVNCPAEHHLSLLWGDSEKYIRKYREVIDRIDAAAAMQGVQIDGEIIREKLYRTWLDHLFLTNVDPTITHVGINDNQLDSNLDYHAEMFPEAKFLFIVRDPRDVAISLYHHKKHNDPGFDRDGHQLDVIAEATARRWVEKVENVRAFNDAYPKRIELVRYEDLISEKHRTKTMERILTFLDLPADRTIIKMMFAANDFLSLKTAQDEDNGFYRTGTSGSWKDEMTNRQINAIQSTAAELMKVLQYEIHTVAVRDIESDGTILPS